MTTCRNKEITKPYAAFIFSFRHYVLKFLNSLLANLTRFYDAFLILATGNSVFSRMKVLRKKPTFPLIYSKKGLCTLEALLCKPDISRSDPSFVNARLMPIAKGKLEEKYKHNSDENSDSVQSWYFNTNKVGE